MQRRLFLILLSALPLHACVGPAPIEGGDRSYRLLLTLRDPTADIEEPAVLRALADQAGAPLRYQDTMSGNTQRLIVQGLSGPDDLDRVLQRLRASDLVSRVEADTRRQPNQEP